MNDLTIILLASFGFNLIFFFLLTSLFCITIESSRKASADALRTAVESGNILWTKFSEALVATVMHFSQQQQTFIQQDCPHQAPPDEDSDQDEFPDALS